MSAIQSNNPGHPGVLMLWDEDVQSYRVMKSSDFDMDRRKDSIGADPKQYINPPSNYSLNTLEGLVFSMNWGEKGFIQNCGTSAIYVKKGLNCSPSSFSFILKGSNAADDGGGGFATMNDWVGDVSICAPANKTVRYMAWKMTT